MTEGDDRVHRCRSRLGGFSLSAISDSNVGIPKRTTVLAIVLTLVMIAWPLTPVAAAAGADGGADGPMAQSDVSPEPITTNDGSIADRFAKKSDKADKDDSDEDDGDDGDSDSGPDDSDHSASDDAGKPDKAGNPEDTDKPDDVGKPDDTDKSDGPGKPDDTGNSDESENADDESAAEDRGRNDEEESASFANIPGASDRKPPDPPEVTVSTSANGNGPQNDNVNHADDSSEVSIKVEDVEPNQQVSVDVSPAPVEDNDVAFDSISVRAKPGGSFTMKVTTTQNPLPGSPAFDERGTRSMARFRLDHSISNEDVEDVSFTFRVSKERIESTATDPEAVVLYRHSAGNWNELDTDLIAETSSHYIYRSESPGMSEFAIGAQRPAFEVWYSDVSKVDHQDGSVKVIGRVTNVGRADGVFTASLTVRGNPVARKEITIAAGGTRQVSFEVSISEPGTYQLYLNSELAGTVTIEAEAVSRLEQTDRSLSSGIFGMPFNWAVALDEGLGLFTPAVPVAGL